MLTKHRLFFIRFFILTEVFLIASTLILFWQVVQGQVLLSSAREYGHFLANSSVVLLCLVLAPGISRRLQKGLFLNRYLMPFRRHLGILMYVTALCHSLINNYLPRYLSGQLLNPPPPFVIFGFFGLILATPLFLTSNNYSVNKLKRNWIKLHRLVYLILFLVLLHITFQKVPISILAGITLFLLILSFIFKNIRSKA